MWEHLPLEIKKNIWERIRSGRCTGMCLALFREVSREWKTFPFFCKGIPPSTSLCTPYHRRKEEPDAIRGPTTGKVDMSIPIMETRVENNHRTRRRAFGPHFWASLLGLTAAAGARGLPCK